MIAKVLTVLTVLLFCCLPVTATAKPWRAIETLNDVPLWKGYHLIVEGIGNATVDDDSPRLRILGPRAALLVTVEGGLVPLREGLVFNKRFAHHNRAASRYVYLSPQLKDAGGSAMLIVLGRAYASDPGSIRVIGRNANGAPAVFLSLDTFEPAAVADLDSDGRPELVGNPSYSQTDGHCLQTYDPFAVYRSAGGQFAYSLELSRTYNLKHYYGWVGRGPSEKVGIVLCGKRRGAIMDWKKAQASFK